ncbi:MAG TPA: roadblock/LC7 domain-containing protein [Verrucomicrobiae bacterium]|nr:roadblock/LC7 domain-containing protein [Verrucomicrobiae bacterium]
MATLPQLIEEDIQQFDNALRGFIRLTDATAALIIDKGGFLITHQGDSSQLDFTSIGALASGAFMANQTIAGLVNESNFNSVYQQGEKSSMIVVNIDEHCLLVVIFNASTGVGIMRYHAAETVEKVATQLAAAQKRNPDGGYDLSVLNLADTESLFQKKK